MGSIKKPRKGGLRFGGAVACVETSERARTCTCTKRDVCPAGEHAIPAGESHLAIYSPGRFGMGRKVVCAKAGRHFLEEFVHECRRLQAVLPPSVGETYLASSDPRDQPGFERTVSGVATVTRTGLKFRKASGPTA